MRLRHILFCLLPTLFLSAPLLAQGMACLDVSSIYTAGGSEGEQRFRSWQQRAIEEEFPHSTQQALDKLKEAYPTADDEQLRVFLEDGTSACATIRGETRWFGEVFKNFGFRNPEFLHKKLKDEGGRSPFFDQVEQFVFKPAEAGYPTQSWQSYVEPIDYLLELSVDIPRSRLPKTGSVDIWLPLPIETASQQDVRLVSITPGEILRSRPRKDFDIGYAWFQVPLEGRTDDVNIEAKALFRSYRQAFQVDPEQVLPYDTSRPDYKEWTRSYENIAITPEIKAAAEEASKGETNPYLAARNIYNHILETVRYSHVPHFTVVMLGIPESVWVHERRHGDCGAQSMYFSAMCRALGIPARATGGYQLFPGYAGTHFWAEVYIEGYGWIPVDPTVADAVDWSGAVTEEQRRTFKEFYFGNLDPYRLVIQNNVDLDPLPAPTVDYWTGERPFFVLQSPWMDCAECEEPPMEIVGEGFNWSFAPVTP